MIIICVSKCTGINNTNLQLQSALSDGFCMFEPIPREHVEIFGGELQEFRGTRRTAAVSCLHSLVTLNSCGNVRVNFVQYLLRYLVLIEILEDYMSF